MKPKIDVEGLRRGGVVALRNDLFSIWVKSACGNVTSPQLHKLAAIAERYGRGIVLFSTRQIPIIPFVRLEDVPVVKNELAQLEMELDRCGPRVRNINLCYEDKACPEAVLNSLDLGEKLEKFFRSAILHKVKIGVSGCGKDCVVTRVLTDIGFVAAERNGRTGYDVYVGGRLGVNPFVGVKMAETLSEAEAVKFVQNYLHVLENTGKPGERAADLVTRLGVEPLKALLTRDLDKVEVDTVPCKTRLYGDHSREKIVRIRATCGEVTSDQARAIADIAGAFGQAVIHFAVHGAPEIPGVRPADVPAVRESLARAGLSLIEKGVDNLQTCFGSYCTESAVDTQTLLRRIEEKTVEIGLNNLDIKITAAGCPNSCGIAHLGDIGFHGVFEPQVSDACNGCGLCAQVCKRKAISIEGGAAVINMAQCAYCGQCLDVCPADAMIEKRRGFAVLVGGREGTNARLGTAIARFVSEDEAVRIADRSLRVAAHLNMTIAEIIDVVGIEKFKEFIGLGAMAQTPR